MIRTTLDGSPTLLHPVLGDAYHSLRGAVGEARHVFLQAGLRTWLAANPAAECVRILEVGLGSGLNCLLTAREAEALGVAIEYCGIEFYPVERAVWQALSYCDDPLFGALHEAAWEQKVCLAPHFTLEKRRADLVMTQFDATFDLVYMDAFAPDTQPEMWTEEVFRKIFAAMAGGGILTTYCAKGSVKRALRTAGFAVERLPGALGKRHMLRATK